LFARDTIPVLQNGASSKRALVAALKKSLPDFMLPSAFVALPALPLNANGKLDRNALPAPDHALTAGENNALEPRTPLEKSIAEIWRALLNIEHIGVHENFFDLGGDSLLGLRIVNRLRETLGCEISLGAIFETPTIAAFAESL